MSVNTCKNPVTNNTDNISKFFVVFQAPSRILLTEERSVGRPGWAISSGPTVSSLAAVRAVPWAAAITALASGVAATIRPLRADQPPHPLGARPRARPHPRQMVTILQQAEMEMETTATMVATLTTTTAILMLVVLVVIKGAAAPLAAALAQMEEDQPPPPLRPRPPAPVDSRPADKMDKSSALSPAVALVTIMVLLDSSPGFLLRMCRYKEYLVRMPAYLRNTHICWSNISLAWPPVNIMH